MRYVLFLTLWLPALIGQAQDTARSYDRLGLLIGRQQTHLQDQQFSSLIYNANELSLQLFYDGKHKRSNWNVSFDVATGDLYPPQYANRMLYNTTEDVYGDITTDSFFVTGNTLTANFQLGYAYDLVHSGAWEVSVGADVRNQLMYPSTFVNLGIMNSASLLVAANAKWYVNKANELKLGVSFPVMGFNTRFPYSGTVSLPNQTLLEAFFDGGTQFVSFGEYNQVNASCGWRFALSPKTGLGLQYDFMWQQYAVPSILKHYATRIGATIDIKL